MVNIKVTVTHLSGLRQGEREVFSSLPISIGRAPGSQLRLAANDTRASARHAELVLEGNRIVIHDLKSTNGTLIKGQRIDSTRLVNGDIVEFGTDGPKLKFEYLISEPPAEKPVEKPAETPVETPGKIAPVKPAVGPPPLALQPASGPSSPQFGIANQAGKQLAVAPPASTSTPSSSSGSSMMPMAIEEREFPFKNRFKYVLFGGGLLLLIAAVLLLVKQILIWTVPAALIGFFLLIMGWSCSRINITANNQGIHYQGILRSTLIRWDDISDLRVFRSRTRLLTDLVYVVQSRNNRNTSIVFAAEDYRDGLDLANLIARRTRQNW